MSAPTQQSPREVPIQPDLFVNAAAGWTAAAAAGAPYCLRNGLRLMVPISIAGIVFGCFMPSVAHLEALRKKIE